MLKNWAWLNVLLNVAATLYFQTCLNGFCYCGAARCVYLMWRSSQPEFIIEGGTNHCFHILWPASDDIGRRIRPHATTAESITASEQAGKGGTSEWPGRFDGPGLASCRGTIERDARGQVRGALAPPHGLYLLPDGLQRVVGGF